MISAFYFISSFIDTVHYCIPQACNEKLKLILPKVLDGSYSWNHVSLNHKKLT